MHSVIRIDSDICSIKVGNMMPNNYKVDQYGYRSCMNESLKYLKKLVQLNDMPTLSVFSSLICGKKSKFSRTSYNTRYISKMIVSLYSLFILLTHPSIPTTSAHMLSQDEKGPIWCQLSFKYDNPLCPNRLGHFLMTRQLAFLSNGMRHFLMTKQ